MAGLREIGELKKGKSIGYKTNRYYVWQACINCGNERWVQQRKSNSLRCHSCANSTSNWKGGRTTNSCDGYVRILLRPNDQFYSMADKRGYVREHRLVVARRLGRCLLRSEPVHHLDGNKANNTDGNLLLLSQANHTLRDGLCNQCELRKELRLLKWRIKELEGQIKNLTSVLMGIK